jgi:hypothetical protein
MNQLPDDMELRPDVTLDDLLGELQKLSNRVIFGREEIGDADKPGIVTAFRSVVIVGGAVGMRPDGSLAPCVMGVFNGDKGPAARATLLKLADKLREIARDLDRMSGRQEPS